MAIPAEEIRSSDELREVMHDLLKPSSVDADSHTSWQPCRIYNTARSQSDVDRHARPSLACSSKNLATFGWSVMLGWELPNRTSLAIDGYVKTKSGDDTL